MTHRPPSRALHSGDVTLKILSDAPLRRIATQYGSEEGAEVLLEELVLAAERRARKRSPPLSRCTSAADTWRKAAVLLTDLNAYGTLGSMGGADLNFCRRVQPLLTRFIKSVLNGGFAVMEESAELQQQSSLEATDEDDKQGNSEADIFNADLLLSAASHALANCGEGTVRRCADTVFEICFSPNATRDDADASSPAQGPTDPSSLRVCFGFADYASGETGALLWAGAVGLSLFLCENFTSYIAEKARHVYATAGRPMRIIELGCGPALVSLVVASMAARAMRAASDRISCCLDVTDIAATVVAEAQRSFEVRNGPELARMVQHTTCPSEDAHPWIDGAGGERRRATEEFRVHPYTLDFSHLPEELRAQYDLVLASDIVYDPTIAAHVAPALDTLLRPGGVALLCCEAHRDGLRAFVQGIHERRPEAPHLRMVNDVQNVEEVLREFRMLSSLTASTCRLMCIESAGEGAGWR